MSHLRRTVPASQSARFSAYPTRRTLQEPSAASSASHSSMVRTARRHHRSRVQIHSFPAEIICKIFASMVEDVLVDNLPPWQLYRRHRGWLQASSVCRQWRTIANGDACLWRVIDVDRTGRGLPLALARAKATSVDITFHSPKSIPSCMKVLAEHAHRINKLVVVSLDEHTVYSISNLLSRVPMPALTELWINTVPHFTDGEHVPDLSPSFLPNLRTLEATNLCFDWQSAIVPRLRQLYLGPSTGQPMRLEGFLRILESCRCLEFLKIDRALPLYDDRDRSKLSVSLRSLRNLYLVTEYPYEVRQLLSHLYLDATTNLDVRVRIDLEGPDDRFASLGLLDVIPQDSSCLPILRTASHALLKDFDFECRGPGGQGRLSVTFDDVQGDDWQYMIQDAVQQFGTLLSHAPLTYLSIYQKWSEPIPTTDLARLLRRFLHITALEFNGLDAAQTDLAAVFTPPPPPTSHPATPPAAQPPAILPHLRYLRAVRVRTSRADNMLPRVMECLRARYMAGTWLDALDIAFEAYPRDADFEQMQLWALGELQKLVRGPVRLYG
ncbi:hypothetical protein C8Q74DRAFT_312262 [Fomes fomentarius]|nr:hypothetical protein C8Q74DRAFT_312262 [Fomes fomentarius]